jgi:hypothetical protein
LRAAELLVLQFEFDLVNMQLFEQGETLAWSQGVLNANGTFEDFLLRSLTKLPR